MQVVHVASEFAPVAAAGDLGEAVGGLARVQAEAGHRVTVVLPAYQVVRRHPCWAAAEKAIDLQLALGDATLHGEVWRAPLGPNLELLAIVREEFYDRSELYGTRARDYDDNDARFIFFAKAAAEALLRLREHADIVHGHDWEAALVPLYLRLALAQRATSFSARMVFTLHDLRYMGLFPRRAFPLCNLPGSFFTSESLEYHGQLNLLKAGILFGDLLAVPTEAYRAEVLSPAHGRGLQGLLASRQDDLRAVPPAIDLGLWNPATDPALPARFTAQSLGGRALARAELAARFPDAGPGTVLVLAETLGERAQCRRLRPALEAFFALHDARLVLAPDRAKYPEDLHEDLAARLRGRVWLAHPEPAARRRLLAGADLYLLPAESEPAGAAQLRAQRYGALPVASASGGLPATVRDLRRHPDGLGWLFDDDPEALAATLHAAARFLGGDGRAVDAARARALAMPHGFEAQARAYAGHYAGLLPAAAPAG